MLLLADVKGLEVVCAAYLSQDKVLMEELEQGIDIHEMNKEALGLPDKGVAKVFKFRTIYGGGAYSFSLDSDFSAVGYDEKQWQGVIDTYYNKYSGLKAWHKKIVEEVVSTGRLVVPCTGRIYEFEPEYGKFPEPKIKNYPVQGLGADIVALARVSLYNRIRRLRQTDKRWELVLLINTIHDSLMLDIPADMVKEVHNLIDEVFVDLPRNFEKIFGKEFNLKVRVETKVGSNWGVLTKL